MIIWPKHHGIVGKVTDEQKLSLKHHLLAKMQESNYCLSNKNNQIHHLTYDII